MNELDLKHNKVPTAEWLGRVQSFAIEDHYSAQRMKGTTASFWCESCGQSLSADVPQHADAYQTYICSNCDAAMYLVLYKMGGGRARQTGYVAIALSNMPDRFLEYMQPEEGFVDPRNELIKVISEDPLLASDKELWHQKFHEVQRDIAARRNVDVRQATSSTRSTDDNDMSADQASVRDQDRPTQLQNRRQISPWILGGMVALAIFVVGMAVFLLLMSLLQ